MSEREEFDSIDEQLSAYLDGEVTDAERAEIEALLDREPERRVALEELAETRALLRGLPQAEISDPDLGRIIVAVSATPELAPVVSIESRRRGRVVTWVAAGSVAAAIAIAMVLPSRLERVTPAVATLNETHSAESATTSVDPLPALAAMSVPVRLGR